MKSVLIAALILLTLLLLFILSPFQAATLFGEPQAELAKTGVLDWSGEKAVSDELEQSTTEQRLAVQEGVPVSSYHRSHFTSGAVLPTLAEQVQETQQFESFAASLTNGQADQVVGVYVPDVFALPVVQQPEGQISFVSDQADTITQFSAPASFGTIGLLAHNYLSGQLFFNLMEDQVVIILHGNGHQERYRINQIERYQALTPTSVYSNFINLADPAQMIITAQELFNRVYTTGDQVVFQTCIEANGDPSWGRIFVIAERVP